MTTLRTEKNANYTTINNTVLNDPRLSWEAKGLAAYLFSKPDNWRINVNQLWGASTNGVGAVKRMLRELEEHGYLQRRCYRNGAGTFEWEQVLYETPQPAAATSEEDPPQPAAATSEEDPPQNEAPPADDSTIGRKPSDGKPSDGKPFDGFPSDGNPSHLVSTDHQVLRTSTDHQVLNTTTDSARAKPVPSSSSSKPGGDLGRSAARAETRPEAGTVGHRQPEATVTANAPHPPSCGHPPAPTPAADAGQVAAVAAALVECDLCTDGDQAGRQALALLADFPADWVIGAALQTAERTQLNDPIAYMRGTLRNWQREGRRQAPSMMGALTPAERRRLYAHEPTPAAVAELEPQPAAVATAEVPQSITPAPVSRETPAASSEVPQMDPTPEDDAAAVAIDAAAAALQRAGVPNAGIWAAQLVANFDRLPVARLVAAIDAVAAGTPGKAPGMLAIRSQLHRLNVTGAL